MNSARYEYGVSLTVPVLLNFALVSAKYLLHTLFWWYTQPLACCFNSLLRLTIRPAEKLTTALGVSLVLVMKNIYLLCILFQTYGSKCCDKSSLFPSKHWYLLSHLMFVPKGLWFKRRSQLYFIQIDALGIYKKSLIRKSDCSFVCSPWVIHFF